jgi:phosphate transport system substrate-binding protein
MYFKRKNKSFPILIGLLILVLLATVVGCQSSTSTASPTETPDMSAPNPTSAPSETGLSGEITEAGSTTVQPLAERLAEAFIAQHPEVEITVQGGGSSVGVKSAGEGTVDWTWAQLPARSKIPNCKSSLTW